MDQAEELEAKEEPLVEVAVAETTKVEGGQDRTKAYDSWGCPGATKETREELGSPSCCSRTRIPCNNTKFSLYTLLLFDLVCF